MGILFAVYLLVNLNSLSGLKVFGDKIPGATIEFTTELASVGDKFQQVSEDGFLQSVISTITGQGVTYSNVSGDVVVEPPVESKSGNLGQMIQETGEFFANVWVSGDKSMSAAKEVDVTKIRNPLAEDMAKAMEPFGHLSRPSITNIPVKDEDLMVLSQDDITV